MPRRTGRAGGRNKPPSLGGFRETDALASPPLPALALHPRVFVATCRAKLRLHVSKRTDTRGRSVPACGHAIRERDDVDDRCRSGRIRAHPRMDALEQVTARAGRAGVRCGSPPTPWRSPPQRPGDRSTAAEPPPWEGFLRWGNWGAYPGGTESNASAFPWFPQQSRIIAAKSAPLSGNRFPFGKAKKVKFCARWYEIGKFQGRAWVSWVLGHLPAETPCACVPDSSCRPCQYAFQVRYLPKLISCVLA